MGHLRRAGLAILSGGLLLISACGSADVVATNGGDGDGAGSGATASCDSRAAAAALAPGMTFDYNLSVSPADLAASTVVVFRANAISLIHVGHEWSTVAVDDVEIIVDARESASEITHFGAFGAWIEDRPGLDNSALAGMTVLVFAHHSPDAPGGLSAAIEGFWLQCPGERPVSVVAVPGGEAWNSAVHSIEAIADATAGELPGGEIAIGVYEGTGWKLFDIKPGFGQPYEVAIMTSQRGLDRAADARWFETRPQPNFDDEVVIVLAPSVPGSCPGISFKGLTITDSRVFGNFEPGPAPAGAEVCTADANPVAFIFLVERQVLPDKFMLSVEETVTCGGCERAQIEIDLSDTAALEMALWGPGILDVVIDGSAPAAGTANVFRWAPEAALMLPASEFTDLPRWIQTFDSSEARTIEGFVVGCGADGCPEECDDQTCQDLKPLGDVCSYEYRPESFIDYTVTITWDNVDCQITASSGRANK